MKAFPNPTLSDIKNSTSEMLTDDKEYGMDLRDYFAAKAMQQIMNTSIKMVEQIGESLNDDEVARLSYMMADAMMRARND